MIPPTNTDDSKYTFLVPERDYRVHVLRYGEPWVIIESGCNAVSSLLYELIDARALIAAVMRWAGYDGGEAAVALGKNHGDLHDAIDKFRRERGLKVDP